MVSENPEQAVENRSWSDFEQWNVLFEALCRLRGFAAVNDLAQVYCRRTRRHTQRDLDAAARSINNWRSGSHAPSARNLAVLAQLLDVASDPALDEAWHTLYRRAKGEPEFVSGVAAAVPPDGSWTTKLFRGEQRRFAYGIAAAAVAFAFVSGFAFWYSDSQAPATASTASKKRLIPFRRTVTLSVGQSTVIHGHRADCGRPAPDKDLPRPYSPRRSELAR